MSMSPCGIYECTDNKKTNRKTGIFCAMFKEFTFLRICLTLLVCLLLIKTVEVIVVFVCVCVCQCVCVCVCACACVCVREREREIFNVQSALKVIRERER